MNPEWTPLRIVPAMDKQLTEAYLPGRKEPLVEQIGGGKYICMFATTEPVDGRAKMFLRMTRALVFSLN